LTLSTAFAVKLFCSPGLAGAADAVPVVADGCAAVVLVSDGLVSDGAVVWADGAVVGAAWAAACARAGRLETGASKTSAASADAASDVMGEKGPKGPEVRRKFINAKSLSSAGPGRYERRR
jgi:hypothetical protein